MPLQRKVYADNLDVTCRIAGDEWDVLQARVVLTTQSTPDYVDMLIAPTAEAVNNFPPRPTNRASEEPEGLLGRAFSLEVDNDLISDRDTDAEEETRIFTGNLANLSTAAEGAWEAIAYEPAHQKFEDPSVEGGSGNFLNTTIDVGAIEEAEDFSEEIPPGLKRIGFPEESLGTANNARVKAEPLARYIVEQSGILNQPGLEANFNFAEPPGVEIGEQPDGTPIYGGINTQLFFSDPIITVEQALQRLADGSKSSWWFDRFGDFHIGAPVPDEDIHAHELQFITDTSAGASTPAWQSVQVIGSNVVSEDGWAKTNLNSAEKYTRKHTLASDGKLDTGLLAEPTFTYRNMEIQTQEEADAVARSIVDKLQEQQKKGKVSVVGFPEIRPMDAIVMPDSENQPMGGDRYGVVKVVHKLNPSDGFKTDIHVGGLSSVSSTLFNEDITTQTSFVARPTGIATPDQDPGAEIGAADDEE